MILDCTKDKCSLDILGALRVDGVVMVAAHHMRVPQKGTKSGYP